MPPEAKLRMRNVGKYVSICHSFHWSINYIDDNYRETPTSAGPNSFYKSRMGFCDPRAGYKRYGDDDD